MGRLLPACTSTVSLWGCTAGQEVHQDQSGFLWITNFDLYRKNINCSLPVVDSQMVSLLKYLLMAVEVAATWMSGSLEGAKDNIIVQSN